MTIQSNLDRWMSVIHSGDPQQMADLLHDDAVFHSPIVHTPQRGKELTFAYLSAAGEVLGGGDFEYTRTFDCGRRIVLEFETKMGDIEVNGVDIIEWNEAGQIIDFKVMVRPLKAIQAVHGSMAAMLERMSSAKAAG